ncbi:MAG TPA: transporter substrate-binding domain-containing protein [Permianibacter sp.]|nr:transporter substrate-binding domain-containing protein [Permianibacter sp.]
MLRLCCAVVLLWAVGAQAVCTREFKTMSREVPQDTAWVQQVFAEAGCRLIVLPQAERILDRIWSMKIGEIDFISAATPLPERLEFARFSIPYTRERVVVVAHQAVAAESRLQRMVDLISSQRPVIGPHFGYYGPDWPAIKAQLQQADRFRAYKSWPSARGMLLRKPESLLLVVEDAANDIVRNAPLPLTILPTPLFESDVVFMFSRKTVSADDVELINAAIRRIQARQSARTP